MSACTHCYTTRHDGGDVIPLHRHTGGYASLVVRGGYEEASFDGRWLCEPGCLILHPFCHAHRDEIGPSGAEVLNCGLDRPDLLRELQVWRVPHLREAADIVRRAPHELPGLIAASARVTPRPLPDWQAHVRDRAVKGVVPLAVAAREAGVSVEHAGRSLKEALGMTPQALRLEARWRGALALLATHAPLAAIAAECGFADQSHFNRTVRQVSGLTPRALRGRINSIQ